MKRWIVVLLMLFMLPQTVSALDYTVPTAPQSAQDLLPQETQTFGEGLWNVIRNAIALIEPSLTEAGKVCLGLFAATMLTTLVSSFPGSSKNIVQLVCSLSVAALLLQPSNTLVNLGSETVRELSDYGKLLLPVMASALAAQGGATASAAMYAGTAFFNAILSSLIDALVIPMIYIYLCLSIAGSAVGEAMLDKLRDLVKWLMTWTMRIILYVFTGYMGITGVVSGTADAAALKAAKLTISGMVPVVGGILSDASEAVLVSAGLFKNAAGVYGLLAIIAVYVGPFIQIGVQYLLLKLTAAVCGVYSDKRTADLIQNISTAMGMILAMTGTVCLMLLISTVCLMKGVN